MLLYRVLMEEFAIYKAMDFLAFVLQGLQESSVKVILYHFFVLSVFIVNIHSGRSHWLMVVESFVIVNNKNIRKYSHLHQLLI